MDLYYIVRGSGYGYNIPVYGGARKKKEIPAVNGTWYEFVKAFEQANGLTYKQALHEAAWPWAKLHGISQRDFKAKQAHNKKL